MQIASVMVGCYPPLRNFFPSYCPRSSPTFISFVISDSCVCVTGLRWSLGQEDVQDEPPAQPEGLVGDVPLEESLVILVSDRLMKI